MKIAFFDTHRFDRQAFQNLSTSHEFTFFEVRLNRDTAQLANGFDSVCCFTHDVLDQETLTVLKKVGVRLVALRCAGYNQVDLSEAKNLGIPVVRVPAYSPHVVAEHAVALLLALNRHIPKAVQRVKDLNFALDGLVGWDLYGKTVGIMGTGKIGTCFAQVMLGFGCKILAYDQTPSPTIQSHPQVSYVSKEKIFQNSDVISLHLPLNPETRHIIDAAALRQMKKNVFLINTGRGALIDTRALIQVLKKEHLGGAGLDVYEEEEGVFFEDLSEHVLQDDLLARLLTFPNVIVTSHQAFLTREALENIAQTTLTSFDEFSGGAPLTQQVLENSP